MPDADQQTFPVLEDKILEDADHDIEDEDDFAPEFDEDAEDEDGCPNDE